MTDSSNSIRPKPVYVATLSGVFILHLTSIALNWIYVAFFSLTILSVTGAGLVTGQLSIALMWGLCYNCGSKPTNGDTAGEEMNSFTREEEGRSNDRLQSHQNTISYVKMICFPVVMAIMLLVGGVLILIDSLHIEEEHHHKEATGLITVSMLVLTAAATVLSIGAYFVDIPLTDYIMRYYIAKSHKKQHLQLKEKLLNATARTYYTFSS